MAYTEKFQSLADEARSRVVEVRPQDVDGLMSTGAIALDIRDKEEHDLDRPPPLGAEIPNEKPGAGDAQQKDTGNQDGGRVKDHVPG